MRLIPIDISEEDELRFWKYVLILGPDDCWPWLGSPNSSSGYGGFGINGHVPTASRASWMIHHRSDIPKGLQARHDCDNPMCVNPGHIKLGTPKDNSQDMYTRQRNSSKRKEYRRLTAEEVAYIRDRFKHRCRKDGGWAIARDLGCGKKAIYDVIHGRTHGKVK